MSFFFFFFFKIYCTKCTEIWEIPKKSEPINAGEPSFRLSEQPPHGSQRALSSCVRSRQQNIVGDSKHPGNNLYFHGFRQSLWSGTTCHMDSVAHTHTTAPIFAACNKIWLYLSTIHAVHMYSIYCFYSFTCYYSLQHNEHIQEMIKNI